MITRNSHVLTVIGVTCFLGSLLAHKKQGLNNPIAFHLEMMGNIMYFHQALQQPDAAEFFKALIKEVNGHIKNKRCKLVKRSEVLKDVDVIPSVWSMRCMCNLTTKDITTYTSKLNIHDGKHICEMHYFDTYAPMVTWSAIRIIVSCHLY